MTIKLTKWVLVAAVSFGSGAAFSQLPPIYLAPETFMAPDSLPAKGVKIDAMRSTFYVRDGLFGFEFLDKKNAGIRPPADFSGTVYVGYESDFVNQAVTQALLTKGVRVTKTKAEADIAITGKVMYRVHLAPYLRRQLDIDAKFDQNQKHVSIADAQSAKQGIGDAAVSVGSALPSAFFNPGEFVARLVQSTMDLSGATSAMERASGADKKQRAEQSVTFGDCYDNTTRVGSCAPGIKRNVMFSLRSRVQYVDIDTFLRIKGQEPTHFSLVSRQIDDRSQIDDDMGALLALGIIELVSGFPEVKAEASIESAAQGGEQNDTQK